MKSWTQRTREEKLKLSKVRDEYIEQMEVATKVAVAVRNLEAHNRELMLKLADAYIELEEWQEKYYSLLKEKNGNS